MRLFCVSVARREIIVVIWAIHLGLYRPVLDGISLCTVAVAINHVVTILSENRFPCAAIADACAMHYGSAALPYDA